MTTDSKESGPRRHDVTVRRIRRDTVVGYRQLLEDLERIRNWSKKSPKNKRPEAGALLALSDFLVANIRSGNGPAPVIPMWLGKIAKSLIDPDYGKMLSANEWLQFTLIFLGMRALTMNGASRKEAARRARRSVKTDVSEEIILSRYDELLKGRVKNPEAQRLLSKYGGDELAHLVKSKGSEAASKRYFDIARAAPLI
jgi:hypothetical protein